MRAGNLAYGFEGWQAEEAVGGIGTKEIEKLNRITVFRTASCVAPTILDENKVTYHESVSLVDNSAETKAAGMWCGITFRSCLFTRFGSGRDASKDQSAVEI